MSEYNTTMWTGILSAAAIILLIAVLTQALDNRYAELTNKQTSEVTDD